jgi:hemolysin activation/secretion protein
LLRSRAENLKLRAAFSWNDGAQDYDIPGFEGTEDRVRALRLGATWDLLDRWRGVSLIDLELSQGLDVLGASDAEDLDVSRPGASPTFTKLALYASRLQSLAPSWSVLLAAKGQYAGGPLLVAEQLGLGGEHFGRAFDASEILGDSGVAGKLELRYSGAGGDWLPAYTAYAYYDLGQVWARNPGVDLDGEPLPKTQSLASAGVGLRFDVKSGFAGYLEIDHPLTRDVAGEGNRNPRVFVGASYRY